MDGVSGLSSRVRLSPEDDEETQAIVARDTKVTIKGTDGTRAQLKEHQQSVEENLAQLGFHVGHAAVEGAEISGLSHPVVHHLFPVNEIGVSSAGASFGAAMVVVGLALGIHELMEAHVKGDAQNAALIKDTAHVAVIGALDLPKSYKTKRLDGDYKHIEKGPRTSAEALSEKIAADPKGRAVLQLHADRGMHAARDLIASKMTVEKFLEANPKVAEQYAKDAAFKEGFDAYLFTKANGSADEVRSMNRGLEERDGWHAQDRVAIRV